LRCGEEFWLCGQGEADHGRAHEVFVAVGIDQNEVAAPEGLDTPVLLVQEMMMMPTHQRQIVGLGFAKIGPMDCVVGITARRRDGTSGETASVVT
jgi:hypothetical protein